MAGRYKWSFHESGVWREAFVTDAVAQALGKRERLIQRWQRAENLPELPGWTFGFHIIVPSAELIVPEGTHPSADVQWCPAAPAGSAAYISFMWAARHARNRDRPPRPDTPLVHRVLGRFDLVNGDRVWVVNYEAALTPVQRRQTIAYKRMLLQQAGGIERTEGTDLRAIMSGVRDDGSRFALEISIDAPLSRYLY